MKTVNVKAITVVAAILGIVLVSPAAAVTVNYTVAGVGPMQFPGPVTPPANAPWGPDGYPGDTVELQAYQGVLDLTPGTYVAKINTLLWTIDYTYGGTATDPDAWSDLEFTVNAPRAMSVHTSSGALAQAGTLLATWETDSLGFAPGSTVDFGVSVSGLMYMVHVTPLALDPAAGIFDNCAGSILSTRPTRDIKCFAPWIQPTRDVMAQFVVDAPVPTTTTSWGHLKALHR